MEYVQFPEGVSVGGRIVEVAVGCGDMVEVGDSVGVAVLVGVFSILGSKTLPCTVLG